MNDGRSAGVHRCSVSLSWLTVLDSLHSAFNSKLNSRDDITILSGERFVESLDLPKSARSPSKSVDLEGIKNQVIIRPLDAESIDVIAG